MNGMTTAEFVFEFRPYTLMLETPAGGAGAEERPGPEEGGRGGGGRGGAEDRPGAEEGGGRRGGAEDRPAADEGGGGAEDRPTPKSY
jgi:hypothetical protein